LQARYHSSRRTVDPLVKLETRDKFAIDLMIDSANMAGLPSNPLRQMALLGIAKRADGRKIVEAVRKQLNLLRTAREVLGPVDDQELTAGASVLSAGAKPSQLATFRPRKKGRNDLQAFVCGPIFSSERFQTTMPSRRSPSSGKTAPTTRPSTACGRTSKRISLKG
jgi:hypothetical protein